MPYGESISRVDGRLKVTGKAPFAGEPEFKDVSYGVLVGSTIANGRIADIDTAQAEAAPGVLLVMTHRNAPKLASTKTSPMHPGEGYPLLQDDSVLYNGQHIALVVADTFEHATYAAGLIDVRYEENGQVSHLEDALENLHAPKAFRFGERPPDSKRGDPEAAFVSAKIKIDETYSTPVEHHNPMEPHAVVASWRDDGTLVVHHSTQAVFGSRESLAGFFGMPPEKVEVSSSFVGGGFGCKGSTWPHVTLAAMAAKLMRKPIKLVLTRKQMFTACGHRSKTIQRLRLSCDQSGLLTSISHDGIVETAKFGEFAEPVGLVSEMMYSCANVGVTHRIAEINTGMTTFMRGPGEATGMFALESAMDELAYEAKIDPIDLRIKNHASRDEHQKKPWSSKSLLQCYAKGAAAFGWKSRPIKPREMRKGNLLIGYGMATATYPALVSAAGATVKIFRDGTALVQSGTQDIGTGTYTIMCQVAAKALGLSVEKVRSELGSSLLPKAPVSGGSQTAASVMPVVHAAAVEVREKLLELAVKAPGGPLFGTNHDDIEFREGGFYRKGEANRMDSLNDVLSRSGQDAVTATVEGTVDEEKHFSMHSFGAHFAEVQVNPGLGTVRVSRYVGAFSAGHILNEKTARSQMIGGIVYGLGMALMEETEIDGRNGRVVNANIAEYLAPVNADVPEIDIITVDEEDIHVNALGIKGVGELPMVGVAAAIANAVYHATGMRVRDLPIRPDKLIKP
jgi:xanthine dehydrogenase YagR molybdenum-binding subunit